MVISNDSENFNEFELLRNRKTEEIITEKKLEELYQVKTRIVYIPEVGRKVCVVAEQ